MKRSQRTYLADLADLVVQTADVAPFDRFVLLFHHRRHGGIHARRKRTDNHLCCRVQCHARPLLQFVNVDLRQSNCIHASYALLCVHDVATSQRRLDKHFLIVQHANHVANRVAHALPITRTSHAYLEGFRFSLCQRILLVYDFSVRPQVLKSKAVTRSTNDDSRSRSTSLLCSSLYR